MLQIGAFDAATNIPKSFLLPLHNEMSYNPQTPAKVILICLQAAENGGENLLAKTADVTAGLSITTVRSFNDNGGIR